MPDLQKEIDTVAKLGREQGQKERPPSNALEPDAYEVAEKAKIFSRYQLLEQPIMNQLGDVSKRVAAVEHDLAQLHTSAVNLSDPAAIAYATDVALSEKRALFVRDVKLEKTTRAALLRFKGDRGIQREARYDASTWGVLQWMVIIFALELLLNAYFYSFHVGLAGGAIVAGLFSVVTAAVGFLTGFLFRLKNEHQVAKRFGGWLFLLVGTICILYLASLTATYRSIAIVQREQAIQSNGTFDYTPAYVTFTDALAKAPQIFFFPATLRLPFQDIQSFLLFVVSLIAFGVAFWKGYTSQDSIWGYKDFDKAHKDAEAAVHADEANLLQIAKQAANDCVAERNAILNAFNRLSRELAMNRTNAESLRGALDSGEAGLRRDFELLIKSYRTANVEVRQTPRPSYFAEGANIDFAINVTRFDEIKQQTESQRVLLEKLVETHGDRLKAEIADAAGQARIANDRVAPFKTDCELQAEREIQNAIQAIGPISAPAGA